MHWQLYETLSLSSIPTHQKTLQHCDIHSTYQYTTQLRAKVISPAAEAVQQMIKICIILHPLHSLFYLIFRFYVTEKQNILLCSSTTSLMLIHSLNHKSASHYLYNDTLLKYRQQSTQHQHKINPTLFIFHQTTAATCALEIHFLLDSARLRDSMQNVTEVALDITDNNA